jgi:TonB-linked SusC/RagA family outer membrane protein
MRKINAYRMAKLFVLSGFFAAISFLSAKAQDQPSTTIKGNVLDPRTKNPIAGATIHIDGSTNTAVTDNKGNFELTTYKKLPVTLFISFVGYQTQLVTVDSSNIELVTVQLKDAPNQLSDVVVVGYGTQKRTDVTGSIVGVSKANLSQPVSSPDNLLEGTVPGVSVTQSSGQPGATSSIRIRGGNSIIGGNEPLYVIDGFPVYNDQSDANTGLTFSGGQLNLLSTINPSDIESIDVLKDASATAIYGTRGANGVVIITTKKGARGSNNISYSGYVGTQQISKKIPLLNGSQWATEQNQIKVSQGLGPEFTQNQIDSIGAGSDWEDAALRTALTQSHQLTISGGDEKSRYYISGNYLDQDGIVINTNLTRYGANASYERTLSSRFKFGINGIVSHSILNGLASEGSVGTNFSNNAFTQALYTSPVVPITNPDGSYNFTNPYTLLAGGIEPNAIADLKSVENQTVINRSLGSFYGEYKVIKDLTLKVSVNGDLIDTKQNYYSPSFSQVGVSTQGYGAVGTETQVNWLNENTLTYDHVFNSKHFLTVLAGYSTSDESQQVATASATNFYTDALGYNSLASGTAGLPTSGAEEATLNSFLGRINYSYNHKYNLTASIRADGSSRFPPGNKYGYFPSVGLSWNVTEEKFATTIKQVVNNLKLRVSAGTTGNQTISPNSGVAYVDYPYLAGTTPDNYSFGGVLATGLYATSLANPNLKWETTAQYDGGIDAGFFNNRINLSVDAYYKKTTNLLLNVAIPQTTGYTQELENIGSVQNKGIEVGITTDNLGKNSALSWRTSLTYATNANKILSLGANQSIVPTFTNSVLQIQVPLILQVGQPIGTFYGYKTDGIVQTGDNLAAVPKPSWITAAPQPGDQKYVDQNKDGVINGSDKVILGNIQPKFTGGITNTFAYKSFDLLIFFQGSYGGKIFNALRQQLEITTIATNSPEDVANAWTTSNPSNTVPRATLSPTAVVSDRWIEDASYLRIKTLSLGYTLPSSIAAKILAKSLRVYVSAQNPVTWTKYKGFDPEASSFEQSNLNAGVDYGAYPSAKTYVVGLNVTF